MRCCAVSIVLSHSLSLRYVAVRDPSSFLSFFFLSIHLFLYYFVTGASVLCCCVRCGVMGCLQAWRWTCWEPLWCSSPLSSAKWRCGPADATVRYAFPLFFFAFRAFFSLSFARFRCLFAAHWAETRRCVASQSATEKSISNAMSTRRSILLIPGGYRPPLLSPLHPWPPLSSPPMPSSLLSTHALFSPLHPCSLRSSPLLFSAVPLFSSLLVGH